MSTTKWSSGEEELRAAATTLGEAEKAYSEEYLLYIVGKTPSWQAEHQARVKHGLAVRQAEAEYEIARARFARS